MRAAGRLVVGARQGVRFTKERSVEERKKEGGCTPRRIFLPWGINFITRYQYSYMMVCALVAPAITPGAPAVSISTCLLGHSSQSQSYCAILAEDTYMCALIPRIIPRPLFLASRIPRLFLPLDSRRMVRYTKISLL